MKTTRVEQEGLDYNKGRLDGFTAGLKEGRRLERAAWLRDFRKHLEPHLPLDVSRDFERRRLASRTSRNPRKGNSNGKSAGSKRAASLELYSTRRRQ